MKKIILPLSLVFALASTQAFAVDLVNGDHTWSDQDVNGGYTSFSGAPTTIPTNVVSHTTGTHTIDFDWTLKALTSSWNTSNPTFKIASGKVLTINEYRGSFRGANNRKATVTFTGDASTTAVPYGLVFTSGMRIVPTESEPTLLGVNSTYDVNLDIATNFTAAETTLYTDNGSKVAVQADGTLGKRVSAGINVLKSANFEGSLVLDTTLYNGVTNYTPLAFRVGSSSNSTATATIAKSFTMKSDYTSLDIYGTMNVNGNIDASKGSVVIRNGGTLQLNYTNTDKKFYTMSFKNLDVYGTLYYKTSSVESNQDTFLVEEGGTINVKSGGMLKASGSGERHVLIGKNATLSYEEGALKNSGVNRIKLVGDGATLKLNSNVLGSSHITFSVGNITTNLVIGTDITVERFHLWSANNVDVNITIENGATLTVKDIFGSPGSNSFYYYARDFDFILKGFEDNGEASSVRFTSSSFITDVRNHQDWVAEAFQAEGWENFYVDENGYLRATQVIPEPAEWAMILGALTLGFVFYRRRR